jgi:hypothetical protein
MLFASKHDHEDLRRDRVRQLFLARCPSCRTANDVLTFFLWLNRCSPQLLPQHKFGDPYQLLKGDLQGLYLRE